MTNTRAPWLLEEMTRTMHFARVLEAVDAIKEHRPRLGTLGRRFDDDRALVPKLFEALETHGGALTKAIMEQTGKDARWAANELAEFVANCWVCRPAMSDLHHICFVVGATGQRPEYCGAYGQEI